MPHSQQEIQDTYDAPAPPERRADLHVHSTCSDGRMTPSEVIDAAAAAELGAVALTDHDTVAGLAAAAAAASSTSVTFVPGLELSTYDDTGSTHLLGYGIDERNARLARFLEGALQDRVRRAEKMVDKLNRLGVEVALDDVLARTAENGLVARPHVAQALLDGGWVKSYGEAFSRFIAAGAPAYVPTRRVPPEEGIRMIQHAGGVAVLAHGGRTHDDAAIVRLRDAGLDGLETLHPDHGPLEVRRMRRLAAELGLLESGGSDWHGPRDTRRGRLGEKPVPLEWCERLLDAVDARRTGSRT